MQTRRHDPSPRLLVIRRDNIGDLVCTTPMFRALRRRFPEARICALVNSYNAPILANNADVDKIYAYTKAKHRKKGEGFAGIYWHRLQLIKQLRQERFDYAVLAGPGLQERTLRFSRLIAPRHILGFTEPGKPGAGRIDRGVPYTVPRPMHEVEDIFRMLAPLGIEGPPPTPHLVPTPAEVKKAASILDSQGLAGTDGPIGIHISARKPSNRWPVEHFAELIKRISKAHQARFALFWSPGDAANPLHPGDDANAAALVDALPEVPIAAYPTLDLGQLIAGLSLCSSLICSDGGAMHIAAALGKPILCFFGKSDATRWHPWGARYVLLQPPSLEASDITVNEAFDAFEQLSLD